MSQGLKLGCGHPIRITRVLERSAHACLALRRVVLVSLVPPVLASTFHPDSPLAGHAAALPGH